MSEHILAVPSVELSPSILQPTFAKSTPTRPIDFAYHEPVNLGNFNPRQNSYYQATAYDASQRTSITMPLLDKDNIGLYPNLQPLFCKGFRGDDCIAQRDPIGILETEISTDFFKRTKMDAPVSATEYDTERENSEYQRIWLYPIKANLLLGLLIQIGYWFSHWLAPLYIIAGLLGFIVNGVYTWSLALQILAAMPTIWLGCFLTWKTSNYIRLKTDKGRWAYADRQTGMLVLPDRKGGTVTLAYKDFEPRIQRNANSSGIYHSLALVHRSGQRCLGLGQHYAIDSLLYACYLEQFMDITQPLPDIPMLEQFRHLDPTTVAYDKESGRNPRFWRDKTTEEIEAIAKERRLQIADIVGKDVFAV